MHRLDPVAQVAIIIGVICTTIMGIGKRDGTFLLGAMSLLIYLTFQSVKATSGVLHEHILKQVPSTIESAMNKISLDSKTIPYAVCSACHCTYAPTCANGPSTPSYPQYCSNMPVPEIRCGEPLLESSLEGRSEDRPKKVFIYHDFNDYLGGLLSRSDIETAMDMSCDDVLASLSRPKPRYVKNAFEAQFLREFNGPGDGKLFIDRGDEGRFAFALHVDFFNPEGMRIRGARTSSGIISMACLNLPINIRYKPENMYLAGIIAGPKQPSLENLNHYIRPLVQDLASSWERGVRYSRTANHSNGRTTRSAVALVVCDLPAARHVSALAGVSSHFFCSACNCYHKTAYGRVDFHNWIPRDRDRMRLCAERWRDAPTLAEREKIFREHGVRYSDLWRLPYWDPSRQLVIDSMHCILEGLVQHHVRNLLGLSTEEKNTDPEHSEPAFEYPFTVIDPETADTFSMSTREVSQVSAIHDLLTREIPLYDQAELVDDPMTKLLDSLLHKNVQSLKFVCQSLECLPQKNTRIYKHDYAKALIKWVGLLSWLLDSISEISSAAKCPFRLH